jgi:putative thioredoxin
VTETVIFDVAEANFEQQVLERSREVPVVVDFWAEWCGPCRTLGPALEDAVGKRDGKVELAKVDVDANQGLSRSFGVQGIPAVKAFRDGKIVAEFTGAIPPVQIEAFLNRFLPSAADELAAAGDEDSLRAALAADPKHAGSAVALARILIGRDEEEEARELLSGFPGDFTALGLLARLDLGADGELDVAFSAWDEGESAEALEQLQGAIAAEADTDRRDLIRRVMVAIFTELGAGDPLATEHRRRLAAALN